MGLSVLTIMFMLTLSFAGAQDATLIGIEVGDSWEYKVVKNTITDENGNIDEFEISSAEGGEVKVGETFVMEITAAPSTTGIYSFSYDNGDLTAIGTADLGEFGSDVIYTDWDHWTTAAEDAILFEDMDKVTVVDGTDEFKVTGVLSFHIVYSVNMTIEVVYYKTTGVFKSMSLVSLIDEDLEEILVENQTGAIAMEVPGFGFIISIIALVAVPILTKKRRS